MSSLLRVSKLLIKAIKRTECGGKPYQALSTIGHREEIVSAHSINKTRDLCVFQYKGRCSKKRYVILNQPFQGPEMEASGISREILLQFRKPIFLPRGKLIISSMVDDQDISGLKQFTRTNESPKRIGYSNAYIGNETRMRFHVCKYEQVDVFVHAQQHR